MHCPFILFFYPTDFFMFFLHFIISPNGIELDGKAAATPSTPRKYEKDKDDDEDELH